MYNESLYIRLFLCLASLLLSLKATIYLFQFKGAKEKNRMKKFKAVICLFCLALLICACEGPIRKHGKPPDQVPVGKIETVDRVVHS